MAYLGVFFSLINSFTFPVYGIIFAKIIFVMMQPKDPNFEANRNFWCGMFLIEVFLIFIVSFIQKYIFLYVGENLTFDIRNQLY